MRTIHRSNRTVLKEQQIDCSEYVRSYDQHARSQEMKVSRTATLKCMVLVSLAMLGTVQASAERYSVSLTRKDRNFYKVDGKEIYVITRYCYTYAYGEDAVLSDDEVVFIDDRDKCDVKMVLKRADIAAGKYEVTVTQESDDLYSTAEGAYIRTSLCLELALAEEAILKLQPYGSGELIFLDAGDKCTVDAVLTRVRL